MTDGELLEAAAAAAAHDWQWFGEHFCIRGDAQSKVFSAWNPLASDAQALQLAVLLGLEVDFEHDPICVGLCLSRHGVREPWGSDKLLAARRAIVRAAAAMPAGDV